jgi:hypothetical protein
LQSGYDIRTAPGRGARAARHSRKRSDAYHTFEEWKPTPHPGDVEDDQSILTYGLMCSNARSSSSLLKIFES